MTDVTSTRKELAPNAGIKEIVLVSTTAATGADTITLTLADYGCKTVVGLEKYVHTTENSVIVADDGTCAVSAGVFTYTVANNSNPAKKRVLIVKAL
jgi:hypothetical protein